MPLHDKTLTSKLVLLIFLFDLFGNLLNFLTMFDIYRMLMNYTLRFVSLILFIVYFTLFIIYFISTQEWTRSLSLEIPVHLSQYLGSVGIFNNRISLFSSRFTYLSDNNDNNNNNLAIAFLILLNKIALVLLLLKWL